MQTGTVEGIYVAPQAGAQPQRVERVRAVAGRGLEGDRNFTGAGTFYDPRKPGRDLTLIEAEAIDGLAADTGIALAPGDARRNVVTRGVRLNDLVDRRFALGDGIECIGRLLCDPCRHLERATDPGVLKGLANRGGLRADVVSDGWLEVGAPLRELGSAPEGAR
jgi:MOSC domain-containing protein YiiM